MRVSVMIPNFSNPDDFRARTHSENAPFATSFIIAHDIVSPEERLKKFDGIEASLFEQDLRSAQLSKDETLILQSVSYPVSRMASDFAYGKKLV